jgi:uncharacterized protein YndB with AHSA1/START domain
VSSPIEFVEKKMNNISSSNRVIHVETILAFPAEAIWQAWTTPKGIVSFFAPSCHIELKVGGLYEILFDPEAEPGKRGSEGMHILALQPPYLLSFTWNAPPELPEIRNQLTHVMVQLVEVEKGQTCISLTHDGWGKGGEWDKAFQYFITAWRDVVFPRLRHSFLVGPIDWDHVPDTRNQHRFIEFFDTSVYNTHTSGG